MGFKSNINYAGYERIKQRGDEGLTRAKYVKKKEDEAEARRAAAEAAAAATRRSGQRSGLQKLGSAALRAGAAYYTGGASEALGFGGAIDDVVLGKDDQGNSIQNEYGEIVRAGSGIYGAMKNKKAGDVARKRGSNIQDYEEQIRLATEMGKLDPKQGARMLTEAQSLRARQQAQTQAGEDASLWGWDNEFDDLELSPSQIAGAKEAERRNNITLPDANKTDWVKIDKAMAPSEQEIMTKYDLDSRAVPGVTGEELDKGEREFRREEDIGYQNFLKGQEEDRTWDRMSKDMDLREGARKGVRGEGDFTAEDKAWDKLSREEAMREMMDREIDEKSAEKRLDYNPALEKTATELKGSPMSKTYSEKEAEKLSDEDINDRLRAGTLDEIAFDSKGRALGKRGGFLRGFDRFLDPKQGREDEQHYQEFLLRQKAALAKEHARTGGPHGGEWLKRGQRPESTLLKRIRAERKSKGSILHS